MTQDFRNAVRQISKSPRFSAVVILILALGVGANTAVFTAIQALVLRGLPVRDPDRLVFVEVLRSDGRRAPLGFNYPTYLAMSESARSLAGLAATTPGNGHSFVANGNAGGETEPVLATEATGNFFSVMGASATLGRTLTLTDDTPGDPQAVVVLSHPFWQQRFGGDPTVVGKTVLLDETPFTIVGVAGKAFVGLDPLAAIKLWFPMQMVPRLGLESRIGDSGLRLVARLQPDIPLETARAELNLLWRQQVEAGLSSGQRPSANPRQNGSQAFLDRIDFRPARSGESGLAIRQAPLHPLYILMIIAALVLLIASANVAGLLLARGATRQREFAVRLALGAGRGRLLRQLLAESTMLALAGGLIGLLLAHGGTQWLALYLLAGDRSLDLHPDARILGFTLLITTVVGVLCGLMPALRFSRLDLQTALKNQAGSLAGRSRRGLNSMLVITQLALSVWLVAGAGLFIRSLQNLRNVDTGFTRENVLLFSVRYSKDYDANRRANLFKEVLAGVEALPGVRSATMSMAGLLSGGGTAMGFGVEGYTPRPGERMNAKIMTVGPNFFETLGIPLLRGRGPALTEIRFPTREAPVHDRPPVVVIGESLARRYFGETNPIGFHILLPEPLEIVGVAKDTKYFGLRNQTVVDLYLPNLGFYGEKRAVQASFEVRTAVRPAAVAVSLAAAIHRIDPSVWVGELRTMENVISDNLKTDRQLAQLAGFFGALALILAGLGLYGLLSYGVAQRTREIGVRMALGARAGDVLALVVGEGMKLAGFGLLAGVALALAGAQFTAKLLYGVAPADPLTFTAVIVVLLAVALVAAWLPARRATKVDPMIALRSE
ncbi:MAG: ABC transporter permease [Opitutaceae bacterium]